MQDLIPLFGIFFVIGVPVMSLAARFVLRPLLMDLTAAVRGGRKEELSELHERIGRLEAHLAEQGTQLDRLVEAELFRRQLEARAMPASAGATGDPSDPGWTRTDH